MSIVCPSFFMLPWQSFNCMCSLNKSQLFEIILYFVQFSSSNCRNIWICMNNFRCFLTSFEIQDGDEMTSFYVLLRHYQQKWYHLVEQAKGYLNNIRIFILPLSTVGVWVSRYSTEFWIALNSLRRPHVCIVSWILECCRHVPLALGLNCCRRLLGGIEITQKCTHDMVFWYTHGRYAQW